jgi:hypothetical protein
MFSSFSWLQYFLFVGFVLFAYFILIGVMYYKKDIGRLLFAKRDALQEMKDMPVKPITQPYPAVHELVSELGLLIRTASEESIAQPELYFAMQRTVKNYPALAPTEFPQKINQYVNDEMLKYGLALLSEEELAQLWK